MAPWFRRSKLPDPVSTSPPVPQSTNLPLDDPDTPFETPRRVPIQFSPSRLQTLYISPSERNLYMAALSELDQPPPRLPLWSEPAPVLPQLDKVNTALALALPRLPQNSPQASAVPASSSFGQAFTATTNGTTGGVQWPTSPKLVHSPDAMLTSGLMVRDEFQRVPARSTPHAMVTLSPPSVLRFANLPVETLAAVDAAVGKAWALGIGWRSETVEALRKRPEGAREGVVWTISLNGQAWKRKGSQELDSIRLLLAVFSALGANGWALVDNLQAASSKKDTHNLLFAYSPDIAAIPPVFFAITLPVPDRISLISPPPRVTPALISSIRNSILSVASTSTSGSPVSPLGPFPPGHSRGATTATTGTTGTAATGVTAATDASWGNVKWRHKGLIKLEGWVHPGVYRFWVSGLRRWPGGRVRQELVDQIHPPLILGILDALSSHHLALVASVPLMPLSKGRDVLVFSSLPSSGLTYRDAFDPDKPPRTLPETPRMETPVLVTPPNEEIGIAGSETVVDPVRGEGRVLPWQSVIDDGPPELQPGPDHPVVVTDNNPPPSIPHEGRTPSNSSNRPLLPAQSAQSSPKRAHKLLKKNSARKRTASEQSAQPEPLAGGDEAWQIVHPPTPPEEGVQPNPISILKRNNRNAVIEPDSTRPSTISRYTDPDEVDFEPIRGQFGDFPPPPTDADTSGLPRGETAAELLGVAERLPATLALSLGAPIRDSEVTHVPIHDSSERDVVSEPGRHGVQSEYGSVGYLPSVMSGQVGHGYAPEGERSGSVSVSRDEHEGGGGVSGTDGVNRDAEGVSAGVAGEGAQGHPTVPPPPPPRPAEAAGSTRTKMVIG